MKLRRIKEFIFTQLKIVLGHRFGVVGAAIIAFFCIIALLAPLIAPHQPRDTLRDSNGRLAIMRPHPVIFNLRQIPTWKMI
jgi:peptide/nickel transport system permease protein